MSFDFILTPYTQLYRSAHTRDKLLGGWYTFVAEDSFGYGPITGEFKTKGSLKLIDITKNSFYNDVRERLIEYSKINPVINARKSAILFPLGFPDYTVYTKFAEIISIKKAPSIDLDIELDAQYYGNRSRCSLIQYDLELIRVLKDIYPDYHGIVSPIRLPNTLLNGYQHSEMCIFNKDNVELVKEVSREQSGGTMLSQKPIRILGAISIDNEFTREYVSSMKEFHKSFKQLPNNSIIEEQFTPQLYVYPKISVINKDNKTITPILNSSVPTKPRKTRKRRNSK